jgi:putative transposase
MPQGLIRIQQSKQSHFVTFSCFRREPRLMEESTCRAFLYSLERVRRTRGIRLYGYVLMPEHVHVLMSEPGTACCAARCSRSR